MINPALSQRNRLCALACLSRLPSLAPPSPAPPALHCLLQHYRVPPAALPPSARPSLVLGVEAGELGIAAGLQDRVVQVGS